MNIKNKIMNLIMKICAFIFDKKISLFDLMLIFIISSLIDILSFNVIIYVICFITYMLLIIVKTFIQKILNSSIGDKLLFCNLIPFSYFRNKVREKIILNYLQNEHSDKYNWQVKVSEIEK